MILGVVNVNLANNFSDDHSTLREIKTVRIIIMVNYRIFIKINLMGKF